MNFAQVGNLLEAIVWLAIGVVLFARSQRPTGHVRLLRVLAVTFAIFGLTDLIEIQTGAWWKPPWLLGIKAVCVASFVLCFWHYLRTRLSAPDSAPPPS